MIGKHTYLIQTRAQVRRKLQQQHGAYEPANKCGGSEIIFPPYDAVAGKNNDPSGNVVNNYSHRRRKSLAGVVDLPTGAQERIEVGRNDMQQAKAAESECDSYGETIAQLQVRPGTRSHVRTRSKVAGRSNAKHSTSFTGTAPAAECNKNPLHRQQRNSTGAVSSPTAARKRGCVGCNDAHGVNAKPDCSVLAGNVEASPHSRLDVSA